MASVTFWKGTLEKFQGKTYEEGRIYFVTDDNNIGSLYLGTTVGETVQAVMISPKRLTALATDTTDDTSTVTAKAVVDFVNANFDAKGAYDDAIDGINAVLAGYGEGSDYATVKAHVDTKLDSATYATDKAATDAILTGFGVEGNMTVQGALDLKADAEDVYTKDEIGTMLSAALTFKGTVATAEDLDNVESPKTGYVYFVTADQAEYVYVEETAKWEKLGPVVDYSQFAQASDVYTKDEVDAFTVNGKSISSSPVLTGSDIAVSASDSTTVEAKFEALQDAIDSINGTTGDGSVTLTSLDERVTAVEESTAATEAILAGFGTEEGETATVKEALDLKADAEDVYTKDEVDDAIANAALVWLED